MDKICLNMWELPPNPFPFLPETLEVSTTAALPSVCCLDLLRKSILQEALKQPRMSSGSQTVLKLDVWKIAFKKLFFFLFFFL